MRRRHEGTDLGEGCREFELRELQYEGLRRCEEEEEGEGVAASERRRGTTLEGCWEVEF